MEKYVKLIAIIFAVCIFCIYAYDNQWVPGLSSN